VGLAISVSCLALTVVAHLWKEQLRDPLDKKVLIHLCCNLALAFLLFAAVAGETDHVDGCFVIGLLLHFFFLTSFMWMLVEGYNLFATFVTVYVGWPGGRAWRGAVRVGCGALPRA
jgi:hypothetical protein